MAIAKYPQRTGVIWQKPTRVRSQIVRRVCETLLEAYGKPRLGNPTNPVDEMVFIIISNKTTPKMAKATYNRIKVEFPRWDMVRDSDYSRLYSLLKPAGLSNIKSRQICETLKKIQNDFGEYCLKGLKLKPESEVEGYLVLLPGVSKKVAKCVMMYTLGAKVLPVDTHVHRIAKRLGWTKRKRADQCHDELEALVAPKYRYSFHVDCIKHGRLICRATKPQCNKCIIKRHCEHQI